MSAPRRPGPPSARAWDLRATRSYWRRLMTLVLIPALAGVVLLVGAAVGWRTARDDAHARTAEAAGVVKAVNSERVGRGGVLHGAITVEFFTGAQTQRFVMSLGTDIAQYSVGQPVTVRFQPSDPSNASVTGSANQTASWMIAAVFGVFLVGSMSWAGRHVWRMRRVLQRHLWQGRPARIAEIPFRAGLRTRAQIVVVLWDPIDDHEAIVMPVGLRRLNPGFQPVTWLCGEMTDDRVVISPPGGKRPLLAKPISAP